jgi:hypothetical protein
MNDRQKRISLLARKNFGTAEKPAFLRVLSVALKSSLLEDCLTDIETADRLRQLSSSNYESAKRDTEPAFARYFSKAKQKEVFDLVSCLGAKVSNAPVILLFRQSELCGAVSVDGPTALTKARSLIEVDGDGLTVVAENQEDGLLLDYNPDDIDCCYELVVWGSLWPVLLLPCIGS